MKNLGLVLIGVGLVIFIFVVYNLIVSSNHLVSPIPENKGVRVIFLTPTK